MWFRSGTAVLAAVVIFCAGCTLTALDPNRPPEWVGRGSGAFEISDQPVFLGVGSAAGGPVDPAAADDQARAAVGKAVSAFISVMTGEYMAAVYNENPAGPPSVQSQKTELALQLTLRAQFPGGEIVERWTAPDGGRTYSLCRLDLSVLKEAVAADGGLEAGLRDFFQARAEGVHEKTAGFLKENPVVVREITESDL
ncbi:MAG: hypothetical protein AB1896_21460 [Thermodesulfobacteriota bacterium]